MKSFSIKNVPEVVHGRLKQRASRDHRSLNGELLALIEEALCSEEQTHTVSGSLSEFLLNSPLRDSGLSVERDLTVVTNNEDDMRSTGVRLLNPW